jgi:hypothetical protein
MKTLRFNFSHPFKGHAIVEIPDSANALCKHLLLYSKESNPAEIPLKDFLSGNHEVTLDCEIDHRFFTHQQGFEINHTLNFIAATS